MHIVCRSDRGYCNRSVSWYRVRIRYACCGAIVQKEVSSDHKVVNTLRCNTVLCAIVREEVGFDEKKCKHFVIVSNGLFSCSLHCSILLEKPM